MVQIFTLNNKTIHASVILKIVSKGGVKELVPPCLNFQLKG